MARASGSYPEGRWFDSTRRYHFSLRRYGSLAQLGEHLPYKQRVTGSSPVTPTTDCLRLLWSLKQYKSQVTDGLFCGLVVQLVRMPACHAGGRRFEPVPGRQLLKSAGSEKDKCMYAKDFSLMTRRRRSEERNVLWYLSTAATESNTVISEKDEHRYGGYRQAVKTQGCGSCIRGFESHYPPHYDVGVSPSGKATDSDSVMRRFESCYPSQE